MKIYSVFGLLSLLSCSTAVKLHANSSQGLRHQDDASDYVDWQVKLLQRIDANGDDQITKEELQDSGLSARSQELLWFQYDADKDRVITKKEVENELALELGG